VISKQVCRYLILSSVLVNMCACSAADPPAQRHNILTAKQPAAGWSLLFDGKSLDSWRASDAPGTFTVQAGEIVVHGPQSHLYYLGPVHNHEFKNFELQLQVLTRRPANSGVYFHTAWQPEDWPAQGFEVQVNNSHADPKRTAGLYDIKDNYASVARDDTWFTMNIRVVGQRVTVAVDDKVITDFTQPDGWVPPAQHPGRRLGSGTFALQGHDPNSEIHYRDIMVRALP